MEVRHQAKEVLNRTRCVHQLMGLHLRQGEEEVDLLQQRGEGKLLVPGIGDRVGGRVVGEIGPFDLFFLDHLPNSAGSGSKVRCMEPRRITDQDAFGSLFLQETDDASNDLAVGGDAKLLFGIGENVRFQQNRLVLDVRHPRRDARFSDRFFHQGRFIRLTSNNGNTTHLSLRIKHI